MRHPACIAALAVLALLACTAPAWGFPRDRPAQLVLAPSGSDSGPCTSAAPCVSLQRAFDLATPGSVVELRDGSYPAQELSGDRGGLVTFQPSRGATVTMGGRLTLAGAKNVKLVGFNFPRSDAQYELLFDACNSNVTIQNSTGRRFFILEGNSDITFDGGSWGGYSNPGDEDSAIGTAGATGPNRVCDGAIAGPAHNIVFDHFVWHDIFWGKTVAQWGGAHPDCFEINGNVDGLTIRNSLFLRCQDSFLAIYTNQGNVSNVTVERTIFKDLGDTTWYGSQWVSDQSTGRTCGNIVFRNNLWLPNNPQGQYAFSSIRSECVPGPGESPVQISGNVFEAPPMPNDCATMTSHPFDTVWRSNLFLLVTPARPACVTR
jgi:hypothetical protein